MKKNLFVLFLTFILTLGICGIAAAQTVEPVIDLGVSEVYSEEDLNSAIDVILAEFDTWEGCELHVITYAGDEESADALEYIASLDKGVFDEAIVFDSAFRSPKEQYGAWEADKEYTWSWYLGRADKGEWQLLTWGWTENYLKSEQYTMDELVDAMNTILAETDTWEGIEMHYMKYAGDEFSNQELADYINTMGWGEFDEAAVFYVCFQSPVEAYGSWDADRLCNWSFYLARVDNGEWQLLTWGLG